MRMGNPSETVRFLDEIDITFSLDSRASPQEHMTSMELAVKPVVFRASYRDINLIMTIVNRALELYGKSVAAPEGSDSNLPAMPKSGSSKSNVPTLARSQSRLVTGHAHVVMSKEQVHQYIIYDELLLNLPNSLKVHSTASDSSSLAIYTSSRCSISELSRLL